MFWLEQAIIRFVIRTLHTHTEAHIHVEKHRNGRTDGQADIDRQTDTQTEDQHKHTLPNRTNTQFDFSPASENGQSVPIWPHEKTVPLYVASKEFTNNRLDN